MSDRPRAGRLVALAAVLSAVSGACGAASSTQPVAATLAPVAGAPPSASTGGATAAERGARASDAWAPPSASPSTSSALVYLTLSSDRADTAVGVGVPATVASSAHLEAPADKVGGGHDGHLDGDNGGALGPGKPSSHFHLDAGRPLVLAPGNKRIVLDGLVKPLVAGDTFTITVRLGSGASVDAAVVVKAA